MPELLGWVALVSHHFDGAVHQSVAVRQPLLKVGKQRLVSIANQIRPLERPHQELGNRRSQP